MDEEEEELDESEDRAAVQVFEFNDPKNEKPQQFKGTLDQFAEKVLKRKGVEGGDTTDVGIKPVRG